jgi:hypothetical protein
LIQNGSHQKIDETRRKENSKQANKQTRAPQRSAWLKVACSFMSA